MLLPSWQASDLLVGRWQLLGRLGAVPPALIWDNEAAVGSWRAGRPKLTQHFEGLRGTLGIRVIQCRPRDPEAAIGNDLAETTLPGPAALARGRGIGGRRNQPWRSPKVLPSSTRTSSLLLARRSTGRDEEVWFHLGDDGGAMDFDDLLGRAAFGSVSFAERLLEQLRDQLDGDKTSSGAAPLEELLARAVGNKLAQKINDEASTGPTRFPGTRQATELPDYGRLVVRDTLLSAALGACVCWGDRVDCPICNGAGTPGWTRPDEQLFESHILPAVIATTGSMT